MGRPYKIAPATGAPLRLPPEATMTTSPPIGGRTLRSTVAGRRARPHSPYLRLSAEAVGQAQPGQFLCEPHTHGTGSRA